MKNKLLLALCLFLLCPHPVRANGEVKTFLLDAKDVFTAPASFDRRDWLTAGIAAGGFALLYADDEGITATARNIRSQTTKDMAKAVKPFGDGKYTMIPAAALYLTGRGTDNKRLSDASSAAIESFVFSGLIANTLKYAIHRKRPNALDGSERWYGPEFSSDDTSFPSGHAAAAFSVLTAYATYYDDTPWIKYPAYTIATATALSRIHDDAHWASDAFAGAAIGYFTAKAVYSARKARGQNLTLIPYYNNGPALAAQFRF